MIEIQSSRCTRILLFHVPTVYALVEQKGIHMYIHPVPSVLPTPIHYHDATADVLASVPLMVLAIGTPLHHYVVWSGYTS